MILTALAFSALLAAQEDAARQARELIKKLRSDKIEDREDAARKLKELGKAALPDLEKASQDRDPDVKASAQNLLRVILIAERLTTNLRKALPGVEERLARGTDHDWTEAFLEASRWKDRKRVYPSMKSDDLQCLAALAVRGVRTRNEMGAVCSAITVMKLCSVAPELVSRLKVETPDVPFPSQTFEYVSRTLVALRAPEALPGLRALLKEERHQVRKAAVSVLASLEARETAGDIRNLLVDVIGNVRVEAINALARFGDKESTPAIVNALDDRDPKVQVAALQALETLEVRDAIPQISRLLKFRNPLVRLRAAEALWRLGVKDGIAELIARMKDNTMDPWAAVVIANLGTKETVPELMKLLKVEASHAQVPAIIVLELLREEAAAPGLIELIDKKNKENEERDVEAIRALGALGARDAVPHLVALLREGTESIKVASIESLGRLGAKEVMPAIERLLEDPSREVRAAAGSCLSEMGSFAGVAALLADERNLFSLNALRRRESWKRLEGLRFKVDPQFPPRRLAVLERLQSEKGLSVEGNLSRFLEDDKVDSVSQWIRVRIGEVTPLDTLRAIGRNSIQFEGELNFEVILEPDRIQMIPTDEAVKFWKEWWKDYQKKK